MGCIDPHIDIGTSWKWVVNFTSWPFYHCGKSPWYSLEAQNQSGQWGEMNLAPTSTWTLLLNCPSYNQSLCWLRFPGSSQEQEQEQFVCWYTATSSHKSKSLFFADYLLFHLQKCITFIITWMMYFVAWTIGLNPINIVNLKKQISQNFALIHNIHINQNNCNTRGCRINLILVCISFCNYRSSKNRSIQYRGNLGQQLSFYKIFCYSSVSWLGACQPHSLAPATVLNTESVALLHLSKCHFKLIHWSASSCMITV
jgi:hypothetical protein